MLFAAIMMVRNRHSAQKSAEGGDQNSAFFETSLWKADLLNMRQGSERKRLEHVNANSVCCGWMRTIEHTCTPALKRLQLLTGRL